jgi:hybrid cluster-associated redox disulfide protein
MQKLNKEMTIGEIIDSIPNAGTIIHKYFHGGCFECPAMKIETLEMGAMLHGHDVNVIIAELEELAAKVEP